MTCKGAFKRPERSDRTRMIRRIAWSEKECHPTRANGQKSLRNIKPDVSGIEIPCSGVSMSADANEVP
jgi:hypothetical protein